MSVFTSLIVSRNLGFRISSKYQYQGRIIKHPYSVSVWNVDKSSPLSYPRPYRRQILSACLDCYQYQLQLVRNAWFTKCKLNPKIPPTKPLNFDHSGDLEQSLPPIDLNKPKLPYQNSEELKSADENVRRIFSLGFGTKHDIQDYLNHEFLSHVQQHVNDYISHGAKIARLTLKIRKQIQYCFKHRKDTIAKCNLNNNIQTRNKLLKQLLHDNRPEFDHVCQVLKVKYIPVPRIEDYVPKFVRPQSLHKANLESEAIRKEKLEVIEKQLEKEKEQFYAEKETIMKQIETDLKAMGVDGQTMMNEIFEKERKEERWLNSKWYKFLQRFPPVQKKYATLRVQQ